MIVQLGAKATSQLIGLADVSPVAQRLVIGASGLLSQPFIDAMNPHVDPETRKYSAIRTAVKMVVCTASGILTRVVGQKLGEMMVNGGKLKLPDGITKPVFASSVGKVFAIVGAVASIFLIDVPFINKVLNIVMKTFVKAKDTSVKAIKKVAVKTEDIRHKFFKGNNVSNNAANNTFNTTFTTTSNNMFNNAGNTTTTKRVNYNV